MLQRQVALALGVAISSFRDLLDKEAYRDGVITEERPAYLRVLKGTGMVLNNASHAALVRVSVAAQAVFKHMGIDKRTADALLSFRKSDPPLQRSSMLALEDVPKDVDWIGEEEEDFEQEDQQEYHEVDSEEEDGESFQRPRPKIDIGVEFPSTLPIKVLSWQQKKEGYGFTERSTPIHIRRDIQAFCTWAGTDFNFNRSGIYARAVQSTTLEAQVSLMRAFLGFVASFTAVTNIRNLNLTAYANPRHVADFLAYLLGRNVGKGHMLQHLSLAKKINAYLQADTINKNDTSVTDYLREMQDWLGVVEQQVSATLASRSRPRDSPDSDKLYAWARDKASEAVEMVFCDRADLGGRITHRTARAVHDAALVGLVTGAFMPPCRLSFVKNINRPDLAAAIGCDDKDCLDRKNCKGNRFEIITQEGPDKEPIFRVRSVVVHGKNDRRSVNQAQFLLPEGDLTFLLLAHFDQGHETLTAPHGGNPRLFVSSRGKPFSDPLFSTYWRDLIIRCHLASKHGVQHFCPQSARTAFVEDFTSAHGVGPEFWDGAAVIMGSSVNQWNQKVYRPSKKSRQAEMVLDVYEGYVSKKIGKPTQQ